MHYGPTGGTVLATNMTVACLDQSDNSRSIDAINSVVFQLYTEIGSIQWTRSYLFAVLRQTTKMSAMANPIHFDPNAESSITS